MKVSHSFVKAGSGRRKAKTSKNHPKAPKDHCKDQYLLSNERHLRKKIPQGKWSGENIGFPQSTSFKACCAKELRRGNIESPIDLQKQFQVAMYEMLACKTESANALVSKQLHSKLQMQCANACLQMQAANAMYKCNVHMQAANAM
ncbi:hypothetical protein Tco_0273378 [Tanacetum coccineum]